MHTRPKMANASGGGGGGAERRISNPSDTEKLRGSDYSLYLLESGDGTRTYAGITKHMKRRLRQHNGEIKGGARYTRSKQNWRLVCNVQLFNTDRQVRSLEWRVHHTRASGPFPSVLHRRVSELHKTMCVARATGLCINWHDVSAEFYEFVKSFSWPADTLHVPPPPVLGVQLGV